MQRVTLGKRGVERLRQGHPWIYRSDLRPDPGEQIADGEVVELRDEKGRGHGVAFYGSRSRIALRVLHRERVEVDASFFRERLEAARAARERLLPGARFLRLVHGEADGLPGLIVDRYGDVLVLQTSVPGTEVRKELLADLLMELCAPRTIVERNDVRSRTWEGLEEIRSVLRGEEPGELLWEAGPARMEVDWLGGPLTGAYLSQRENAAWVGELARGRCLDLFAYRGAFALQMAPKASELRAVEWEQASCAAMERNFERSGLQAEIVEANAFDWMRDELARGGTYDTIVLDPPPFVSSRAALDSGSRAYKEVNLRALQLAAPGALLFTFSHSYLLHAEDFEALVVEAANDARRDVQVLRRLSAGVDMPERLGMSESRTLTGLALRVLA